MNQLEALKKYTTVVADSGDIEAIRQFQPQDATTNPSLVLKAAQLTQYQSLVTDAIGKACSQGGNQEIQLANACDQVAVDIGTEVLRHVPGRISTEVDARFAFDRGMCVSKARKIIRLYEKNGVGPERILIKLAATWEGIRAAEELEQSGINCNLTLLFSFAQARACAEAGVFLISPFVGRIFDWYQKNQPQAEYLADRDPGVVSVRKIYQYYKAHGYSTVVMGASFRRIEQIQALSGCDRLTISPALLDELAANRDPLPLQLQPGNVTETLPSPMTQAEFLWQHHQDPMAVEKLAEGIRLFAVDQLKLENQIRQML
ncbi:TPA: transaldolase [Raoultella planticola]|jgi:transaldolase|uniref:transaldolase n=1 Tax=Raoultella TaxID=160674 RepID=UPI00062B8CBF|nr:MULTISPECIES: transaldolase [Raoultella]EMD1840211.1 transaldolase [Raoultella planticola]TCL45836.1 transaldolase [Raoultella planticola]TDV10886.1 transaldolase [Raoultella planticola]TDX38286.1 transaldolase [Raoultella planticola]VTM98836.1 Transaldolase A [Raoultella planticola]